jgi:hypothetical protein
MKRRRIIAICIITVIAVSLILVAYNSYRNTQVDTSWVETANSMLKDYHFHINDTNPDWGLSLRQLHLLENGTHTLLYFGSEDNLTNYLISLLDKAPIQKGTITSAQFEQILASSKTLEITYRFYIEIHSHRYNPTYFILESSQNQNLSGTIIVKEGQSPDLNILAVSKLPGFS